MSGGRIDRLLVRALIALVRFYQMVSHPFKLGYGCCRFTPTCSEYMIEALQCHGPLKGLWLGVRRILRCHPFGSCGYDPVPPKE